MAKISKVAKKNILIPDGVDVVVEKKENNKVLKASGKKGELDIVIPNCLDLVIEKNNIKVIGTTDSSIPISGTYNSLIRNVVNGVDVGFEKKLDIRGVGYKVEKKNNELFFSLGKSHLIKKQIPDKLDVIIDSNQKGMTIRGIEKQSVNYFSSFIISLKKPSAYHNKGIYYLNEQRKLKPTKSVSKKA